MLSAGSRCCCHARRHLRVVGAGWGKKHPVTREAACLEMLCLFGGRFNLLAHVRGVLGVRGAHLDKFTRREGRNCGLPNLVFRCAQPRRRLSRLGCTSCRRATSAIFVSGVSVSSTRRTFSALVHRPRHHSPARMVFGTPPVTTGEGHIP